MAARCRISVVSAAAQAGLDSGDELLDIDSSVLVRVEGRAQLTAAAERNLDPENQLVDVDLSVAVTVARTGGSRDRRGG